jgi:hypothetical protein
MSANRLECEWFAFETRSQNVIVSLNGNPNFAAES